MLAMIANLVKYLIGKNPTRPTYPGRRDTHSILPTKISCFIYGINIIDHITMIHNPKKLSKSMTLMKQEFAGLF